MFNLDSEDLISKKDIKKFIDYYARGDNWHNIDKKSGNLGYGWGHYALIRNLKPGRVLTIGSRYGYIPAVCALACKHNERGVVDFIDAGWDQDDPDDSERHWGGVGFWDKVDIDKHFDEFGLGKYIDSFVMTSESFYKKNKKKKWGYIYLDGDHSYEGIKSDFERFWPRLTPGGYMVFHDLNIKKLGGFTYGVWRLWKELKGEGKNAIEVPGEYGLGIIQK